MLLFTKCRFNNWYNISVISYEYCPAAGNLFQYRPQEMSAAQIWTLHQSSSARMRDMNHNWLATKQRLHPQSVAEISRHSVLSEDRIRQCGISVTQCNGVQVTVSVSKRAVTVEMQERHLSHLTASSTPVTQIWYANGLSVQYGIQQILATAPPIKQPVSTSVVPSSGRGTVASTSANAVNFTCSAAVCFHYYTIKTNTHRCRNIQFDRDQYRRNRNSLRS